jgi:hypothetical protein
MISINLNKETATMVITHGHLGLYRQPDLSHTYTFVRFLILVIVTETVRTTEKKKNRFIFCSL